MLVRDMTLSFESENNTQHDLPIPSWNWLRPSVLSASKSKALLPIRMFMTTSYLEVTGCVTISSVGAPARE
jgi:hypothetical protein